MHRLFVSLLIFLTGAMVLVVGGCGSEEPNEAEFSSDDETILLLIAFDGEVERQVAVRPESVVCAQYALEAAKPTDPLFGGNPSECAAGTRSFTDAHELSLLEEDSLAVDYFTSAEGVELLEQLDTGDDNACRPETALIFTPSGLYSFEPSAESDRLVELYNRAQERCDSEFRLR